MASQETERAVDIIIKVAEQEELTPEEFILTAIHMALISDGDFLPEDKYVLFEAVDDEKGLRIIPQGSRQSEQGVDRLVERIVLQRRSEDEAADPNLFYVTRDLQEGEEESLLNGRRMISLKHPHSLSKFNWISGQTS